jgi:hypothetical protein
MVRRAVRTGSKYFEFKESNVRKSENKEPPAYPRPSRTIQPFAPRSGQSFMGDNAALQDKITPRGNPAAENHEE